MKTLLIAFGIALLGIVIVFPSLTFLGVDKTVVSPIAAAILGTIPSIRESLDKYIASRTGSSETNIISFEGFALSQKRLILYSSLIIFSVMQLASAM